MQNNINNRFNHLIALVLGSAFLFSCEQTRFELPKPKDTNLEKFAEGSLSEKDNAGQTTVITQDGTYNFTLQAARPAVENTNIVLEDRTALEKIVTDYNTFKGTNARYRLLPDNYYEFSGGTIQKDANSAEVSLIVKNFSDLPYGEYMVPLSAKAGGEDILRLVFVTKFGDYVPLSPTNPKPMPPGAYNCPDRKLPMKMVAYVGTNNQDVRNIGQLVLKNSKKPVFDIIILFAANMNYTDGKATLFFNDKLQPVINDPERYIKPLKDRGITVLMDILPNHQGVGYRNFQSYEEALEFANQCKVYADKLGIDGWDIDEEYADYQNLPSRPTNRTSFYWWLKAMKEVMPDKLLTLYEFGVPAYNNPSGDGKTLNDYIDYSWRNYGETGNSLYGTPNENFGSMSVEAARSGTSSAREAQYNLQNCFGLLMFFEIKGGGIPEMNTAAQGLSEATKLFYGEECEFVGDYYAGPNDSPTSQTPYRSVAEVSIKDDANTDLPSLTLNAGESKQLVAEILPGDASQKAVSWSSSDETIAQVSANGLLTTKSAGNATITVTTQDSGKTDSFELTVLPVAATAIDIAYCSVEGITNLTLVAGEEEDLSIIFTPANATRTAITWSSSDETVATVAADKVKALNPGTTTITATTGTLSKSFELTVAAAGAAPNITVKTEADLRLMACRLGATYTLANDITLSKEWTPIGTSSTNAFTGTLDGGGYTIKNLAINRPNNNIIGLIGANSGTIKNIGVEVAQQGITGRSYVGALVGFNTASGHVSGIVTGSGEITANGGSTAGGLVGYNDGTVIGYSSVAVSGSWSGGLVGGNNGTGSVAGYSEGDVGIANNPAGGLVGYCYGGTVVGYYVNGTVEGLRPVGGLIARFDGGQLTGYTRAGVSGSGSSVGPIVGLVAAAATVNAYYSGKSGESEVTGGGNTTGTSITIDSGKTQSETGYFDKLTFGTAEGEWTFFTGKWPAINFPADKIFDNYRGDKQPIEP